MITIKNRLHLCINLSSFLLRNTKETAEVPAYGLYQLSVRYRWDTKHLGLPSSTSQNFRRKVHYPEKYTVKPLDNTNLGGRDPATGRVVISTLGGGIKHKYHWIDWVRDGPTEEGPPVEEKVLDILKCGCRTPFVALVGVGSRLKYILATVNMKPGDIIRTSRFVSPNPVFAKEGDAYPLGSLIDGTLVNCIEKFPGEGGAYVHAAGTSGTILRKVGNRVIVQLPSKLEVSLENACMATVGQLSNPEHSSIPIGNAQNKRLMGRRPRSGWWKRKDHRYGRRIKEPPPVKVVTRETKNEQKIVHFTYPELNMTKW